MKIVGKSLEHELNSPPRTNSYSFLLEGIAQSSTQVAASFIPYLIHWLKKMPDVEEGEGFLAGFSHRLNQIAKVIRHHGDQEACSFLSDLAQTELQKDLPEDLEFVWLPTLMALKPENGIDVLEERFQSVQPGMRSEAVKWMAHLFGDRHDSICLDFSGFTPRLLLKLVRLAYMHVRQEEDLEHEGVFTPEMRDNAQDARNNILRALLATKGEEGWAVKLEMAEDPLFSHFRDRIRSEAEESWAEEVDSGCFHRASGRPIRAEWGGFSFKQCGYVRPDERPSCRS